MTGSHCTSRDDHGEGHGHSHDHGDSSAKRLGLALAVIAGFALVEVAGGLLSGSLALLADAGHMVTDAAALALALSAQWIARKPSSERFPFGLKRAQVLAAFVNGLGLLLIVGYLLVEALRRLGSPREIDAGLMLVVAVIGLGANIVAFFILHAKAGENVNVRGAMLHVAADIFGSVAAIASALVIMASGFYAVDAILTLLVCLLILRSTVPLLRETGSILLQAAPPGLDTDALKEALLDSDKVVDVHQIRAWQLTPEEPMLAMHAVVAVGADGEAALFHIKKVLRERFGITQSTVQLEVMAEETVTVTRRFSGCPDVQAAE